MFVIGLYAFWDMVSSYFVPKTEPLEFGFIVI